MNISTRCSACGAYTPIDAQRGFGFCSWCGNRIEVVTHVPAQPEILTQPPIPEAAPPVQPVMDPIGQLLSTARQAEEKGNFSQAASVYSHVLALYGEVPEAREGLRKLEEECTGPNLIVRRIPRDTGTLVQLPVRLKSSAGYFFPPRTLACGETLMYNLPPARYSLYLGRTGPGFAIKDRFTRYCFVCEMVGSKVKVYRES